MRRTGQSRSRAGGRLSFCAAVFAGTFVWMAVSAGGSAYGAAFQAEEIAVGSKVSFGVYEQDEDKDGKEELEWLVLEKDAEGEKAMLITCDCIECMPFHSEKKAISWEDSTLRQWLNTAFMQEAFSRDQWSWILETDIDTREAEEGAGKEKKEEKEEEEEKEETKESEKDGIITTKDRVFVLSDEEARHYFGRKGERRAGVSKRIESRLDGEKEEGEEEETETESEETEEGAEEENREDGDEAQDQTEQEGDAEGQEDSSLQPAVSDLTDAAFWWLRTPGAEPECVQCVGAEGSIVTSGYLAVQPDFGVRPVIWVELD